MITKQVRDLIQEAVEGDLTIKEWAAVSEALERYEDLVDDLNSSESTIDRLQNIIDAHEEEISSLREHIKDLQQTIENYQENSHR